MSAKDEFIVELSQALFGKMTQAQINGQIQYYEKYIMEEVRKGKTEEQVIEELGSPRLLAKTITLAAGQPAERPFDRKTRASMLFGGEKESAEEDTEEKKNRTHSEADQYEPGYHGVKAEFSAEKGWDIRLGKFKINSWYGTGIILGIILIIAGIIEKFKS